MAAKKRKPPQHTSGRKRRPEVRPKQRPVDKHYELLLARYQPVIDARERFHRQIDAAKATYLRQRESWKNRMRDLGLPTDGPSARLARTCDYIAYAYDQLRQAQEPYDYLDLRGRFTYLDTYEALLPKARAEVAQAEAKRAREAKRAQKNGTSRP